MWYHRLIFKRSGGGASIRLLILNLPWRETHDESPEKTDRLLQIINKTCVGGN